MPVRLGVRPPAEFIRDHLQGVSSDYIESMHRIYSVEVRGAGHMPPSYLTFRGYIWVLKTLGALAFDRAELAAEWRGGDPKPNRHFYRIQDAGNAGWDDLRAAYNAQRGVAPAPAPRPRVRTLPAPTPAGPPVRRGRPTIADMLTEQGFEVFQAVETLRTNDTPQNIDAVERLFQQYFSDLEDRLEGTEDFRPARGANREAIEALFMRAAMATGLDDPRVVGLEVGDEVIGASRLSNIFGLLRQAARTGDHDQDVFVPLRPGSGPLDVEGSRFRFATEGRTPGVIVNYNELVEILLNCCPNSAGGP